MISCPFSEIDPVHQDFQYLEDMATASWFSEVLFASIELRLFYLIESHFPDTRTLARVSATDENGLTRLLRVLERQKLISMQGQNWRNSRIARKYLLPDRPGYMGNFLLYRKYMQPNWQTIVRKLSLKKNCPERLPKHQDYHARTFNYVRAMDELVKQKAEEIFQVVGTRTWKPPVIDIGGGTGALARFFLEKMMGETGGWGFPDKPGDLFELEEVLFAAGKLYPNPASWRYLNMLCGDFRKTGPAPEKKYGLILLSNFLHTYDPDKAERLVLKACGFLKQDGMVLIHDYYPDRRGRSPFKGPLYDINMMLNTYNGRCHMSWDIRTFLERAGIKHTLVRDLRTDSSIVLGFGEKSAAFEVFFKETALCIVIIYILHLVYE